MKRQKITLLTLVLIGLFVYVSCRKIDYRQNEQTTIASVEEKFFNSHRTADPSEKVLVEFLKRQNDKLHFVEKTAMQIGFPRWNKAIAKGKLKANQRTSNDNSKSTLFYIPFTRDSDNYVNAAMIIKISASDTSFSYLCDWQYRSKVHGAPNAKNSVESYALFFMLLDNQTLGHQNFRLTDTKLFSKAAPRTNHNRKLQILNIHSSKSNARTSLYEYHEICLDFYVCGDPDWCADNGGCDYLNCASPSGASGHCYLVQAFCDGWWEDDGSGGGGTGGGSTGGGSGGGGSGSGDGTPPTCSGTPVARTMLPEGCTSGWQPYDGGGGGGVPSQDPCTTAQNAAKKMDTIFTRSKADSVLASIPNLATETKEKGFPIIKKIKINPSDVTDTTIVGYRSGAIQTGTDSTISYTYSLSRLEYTATALHTHPPSGYSAHSVADIYHFLEARLGEEAHYLGTFVAAANGSQYALTITDPNQASAFLATKNQNLSGTKWKEDSDIGKAFEKATKYFEEKFSGDPNKKNIA